MQLSFDSISLFVGHHNICPMRGVVSHKVVYIRRRAATTAAMTTPREAIISAAPEKQRREVMRNMQFCDMHIYVNKTDGLFYNMKLYSST